MRRRSTSDFPERPISFAALPRNEPATVATAAFTLSGVSDGLVSPTDVAAWAAHAGGSFRLTEIDGGHFFLTTHRADVVSPLLLLRRRHGH